MAELTDTDIREHVRERYAAAARTASGCCGSPEFTDPDMRPTDKNGNVVFGHTLYGEEAAAAPRAALQASLGCGVPTAARSWKAARSAAPAYVNELRTPEVIMSSRSSREGRNGSR